MTIALVNRNQGAGATATQTIPLTVAAADVLVMMVHFNTTTSGSLPTLAITDSAGNTWNRVGFSQDNGTGGNFLRSEMWVAVNKTFAGSNTATLTFSASLGAGNATYQFVNFSGADNNFPVLDGCTFTADYTGSASNPGNTQLVTLAGAMSVAMVGKPGSTVFSTPTNYSVMGGNISSTPSTLGPYSRLETTSGTDKWSTGDSFTYWAAGSLTLRPAGTFKASATPALRNSAFVGGGTTGSISSGAITTAANDYMLAVVHFDNHTAGVNSTVTGISDANGTPWAKLASSVSTQTGQFQSTEIWGAVVPASGTTPVTVTIATSGTRDASSAFVGSFSGVDTSSPIAMPFSFVTNYTASAVSLTPSGTLQHGDIPLIVTGYQTNDNTAQETLTSTTGWTTLPAGSSGSSCQKMYDQVEGSNGGIFVNSATYNAGDRGAAFIGALRAANSFLTALDGSATNSASAAASVSATLTTTKANDAVVAVVYNRSNKASPVTCSSITGTNGLTWTLRSRNTVVSSDTSDEFTIEVFYAIAASALSGKTIVANMSASCDVGLIVFGVSGVNTTTPWDASGSFNNKNPNSSPQTLTRLQPNLLSTTNADDFVFAMAVNDVSNAMSVGSIAGSLANALGTVTTTTSSLMQFGAEYLNFATALSGKDAIFQAGNSSHWLVVSDALTAGPSSAISPSGTITTALTKPALALVGKETFKGTINTALSKANLAATGTSRFVGTITMNLSRVQMALAGKETFSGSIATHLQGISQHLTAPGNSTGTISMTLPKTLLAAAGEERFIGTINTALRGFNVAQGGIVAREIFVGSIHTNLSGFLQIAGVAEERFVGTIRTRLGTANTLVTTDVKGLLIILGDIYTNLYPPDLTLLGAKIGAPGQGQWYSYRYLDSGSS